MTLREILARVVTYLRERPARAARARRPDLPRSRPGHPSEPHEPQLFSREQREAARRAGGIAYEERGTHGGPPAESGWGKDDEARPHD